MGSENRTISRYEATTVYRHPEAKVDIVLVHGLNGEPETTWTAKNGTFWPLDLLPTALRNAHANILVYGYNADVYSKGHDRTASSNFILEHAQTLVASLTFHRQSEETHRNPIIWVCHSLGGILVKTALLYSNNMRASHLEDLRSIFVSTFGLIFLGTPHIGSDAAAWGIILQALANALIPKTFFSSQPVLLKTLRKDNEILASINCHFLEIHDRFEVHMVHENQETNIKGKKFIVVDAKSAAPPLPGVTYYGIEACHSEMCKFDSIESPGFRNITTTLEKWIEKAPCLIQERWFAEEDESQNRALARVKEIMSPYTDRAHACAYTHTQKNITLPYPLSDSIPGPAYPEDDCGGCESKFVQRIEGRRSSQRSSRVSDEENVNQFTRWMPRLDDNRPTPEYRDNWAPDSPINANRLRYSSGHRQYLPSRRRTLVADAASSLLSPNSLASRILRPLLSTLKVYASKPTSCKPSARPKMSIPHTTNFLLPNHALSIRDTESSPQHQFKPFNIPAGHQPWYSRQSGPCDFENGAWKNVSYSPREDTPYDNAKMTRFGSQGMDFNGHHFEFGQSEFRRPKIVCSSTTLPPETHVPWYKSARIQFLNFLTTLVLGCRNGNP
ncbi:hypothetical protein FLONG3_1262 [Fusarium longipes]|uniref:DUF676 domain-containing protein n=1 Tax=Fusarium longipes TaxID=694270 RepID=A0A395T7G6_9HYPO|nr:hypothetical protein FLONG3_1262 [Fusarium longipes]